MPSAQEYMLNSPVIAAAKDLRSLRAALESDCQVVFLLFGTVLNIDELVQEVQDREKACFVHLDLVEGLSSREIAVDALIKFCHPDGIISTRPGHIRRAQQLGLLAIQRAFLLDSMSMESLYSQVQLCRPDYIEILPGIIPSVLKEIAQETKIPLIAGGLIRSKQDVISAIRAGAVAVSTTCQDVWAM